MFAPLLSSFSHQPSILNRQLPRTLRFQALFTKKTQNPSLHRLHPLLLALTINLDRIVGKTLALWSWIKHRLQNQVSLFDSSFYSHIKPIAPASLLAIGIALSIALSSKHCCCLQASSYSSHFRTDHRFGQTGLKNVATWLLAIPFADRALYGFVLCIKHHFEHQVSLFDSSFSPHIKALLLSPSITLISKHSSRLEESLRSRSIALVSKHRFPSPSRIAVISKNRFDLQASLSSRSRL